MKKNMKFTVLAVCMLFAGCNSDSSEDTAYDDMLSSYTLYTVAGIWDALENSDDVNGTYILLEGEVLSINDQVVRLIDTDTSKTVECDFSSDFDISALAKSDYVTIGGICRFVTDTSDTSDYPYLEDCDYYYIG